MAKVTLDNLAAFIHDQLSEYVEDVSENVGEAVHKVALTGVRALRSESPGKRYPKGWRTWSETTRLQQKEILYNASLPDLPHLLEHGHAKRNGGRTRAIVHIQPIEEELIKSLESEVTNAV